MPHMIRKRLLPLILAVMLIISALQGCTFNRTVTSDEGTTSAAMSATRTYADKELESFNEFTNEIVRDSLKDSTLYLHYYMKNPEKYGIAHYSATLGDYDFENLDDTSDLVDQINKLSSFKYEDLSKEQQLTYDILKYTSETSLDYCDLYLFQTELTPYTGINVSLPTFFPEYTFYSKQDIEDYIALLNDTPRYYGQVIQFETLRSEKGIFMEDAIADSVIEQCETFINENQDSSSFLITTFDKRIDEFSGLTDEEKNSYKALNQKAVSESFVPAYQILIDGVKKLKGTNKFRGGLCAHPDGQKYYEYLLKDDLGWSKSVTDLDALLDQYIKSAFFKMSAILKADPSLQTKFEDFQFSVTDPEASLADLKTKISKDFPAGPDISYSVKDIDSSLEDKSNPAMYFIPQIDNYSENLIFINRPKLDKPTLYSTMAHEGFPGHMYQSTYFASKNPSPIRQLIRPEGYIEGWGEYSQLYSYSLDDAADNNKLFELVQCNEIITLAIDAKIDIGIHYYGWSKEYIANFLSNWGLAPTSDEALDSLYEYLVAEPASYPKYALGCFAFMDFKSQAKGALGDAFDIKEFHEFILNIGPAPFDIVQTRLNEWLDEKNAAR